MSTASSEGPAKRRRNVLVFLPLIAFAALAALFFYRLGAGDPLVALLAHLEVVAGGRLLDLADADAPRRLGEQAAAQA